VSVRATERVHTGPAFDLIRDLTGPGFGGLSQRIDKSWLPNPPQAAAQNLRLCDATLALIEAGLANTIPQCSHHSERTSTGVTLGAGDLPRSLMGGRDEFAQLTRETLLGKGNFGFSGF
jgi:hypothetical protein